MAATSHGWAQCKQAIEHAIVLAGIAQWQVAGTPWYALVWVLECEDMSSLSRSKQHAYCCDSVYCCDSMVVSQHRCTDLHTRTCRIRLRGGRSRWPGLQAGAAHRHCHHNCHCHVTVTVTVTVAVAIRWRVADPLSPGTLFHVPL